MFLALPKGSKPSKSISTDATRPTLTHAELRQADTGDWELCATDSYQLARVALIRDDSSDITEPVAGSISADALKAIEKSGGFRATETTIEPCDRNGLPTGATFARTDAGQFPRWDSLEPDNGAQPFSIGVDAELLFRLAQSLGSKERSGVRVKLTFVTGPDGNPNPVRPITVRPLTDNGSSGLLMPVRCDV